MLIILSLIHISFNKLSGGVMQFSYTSTGDIIDTVFIPKD